jgi:hypothetical protein
LPAFRWVLPPPPPPLRPLRALATPALAAAGGAVQRARRGTRDVDACNTGKTRHCAHGGQSNAPPHTPSRLAATTRIIRDYFIHMNEI